MLEDLSKSIKSQLYERVSSPLLVSFGLSWLAWNYRFVLVLLSSLSPIEKLGFVDTHIFPTNCHVFLQGFLYPLVSALVLIFLYPKPAKYVYKYWRIQQRELKEIRQKIDDETPMSRDEAREIRREALKLSYEHEKEILSKTTEISRLKDIVKVLEQNLDTQNEKNLLVPNPNISDALNAKQMEMLNQIAESSGGIQQKSLLSVMGGDIVVAEYNLGVLVRMELVTKQYSTSKGDYIVKTTHDGLARLVERRQD